MIKKYLQNNLLSFLLVVIFVSFFILTIGLAWTEPTSNPPGGNVAAPINVGTTTQAKAGPLILNLSSPRAPTGLAVFGDSYFNGNVGIGTIAPTGKLQVSNHFYNEIVTVLGRQTPRCTCDSNPDTRECPSSFETSDPTGSICYDQFKLGVARSVKFEAQDIPSFLVSNNGSVGIGTTPGTLSPESVQWCGGPNCPVKVDINGNIVRIIGSSPTPDLPTLLALDEDSPPSFDIKGSGTDKAAGIVIYRQGTYKWGMGMADDNSFILWNPTLDSHALFVDPGTNNIGIGTTEPRYKLDVAGDIRATGAVLGTPNVVTAKLTSDISTDSTSPTDTGVSASMTTRGGKVLIIVDVGAEVRKGPPPSCVSPTEGDDNYMWMRVVRDETTVVGGGPELGKNAVAYAGHNFGGFTIIDNPPAGTHTYKVQYWVRGGVGIILASSGTGDCGGHRLNLYLIELAN